MNDRNPTTDPYAVVTPDKSDPLDLPPAAAVDSLRRARGPAYAITIAGTIACVVLLLAGIGFCLLSLSRNVQALLVGGCSLIVASLLSIFPSILLWRFRRIIERHPAQDCYEGVVDAVIEMRRLWQYAGLVIIVGFVGGIIAMTMFLPESR